MAERNPAKNIDRLRAETGTEQVADATGITEITPGNDSAYQLGVSTMKTGVGIGQNVDDWPTANGVINSQKIDDDFMTQTYTPTGAAVDYILQRKWDDTPISFDDDFNGSFSTYRWVYDGNVPIQQDGYYRVTNSNRTFTNWRFENGANAWEVQFDLDITNSIDLNGFKVETVPQTFRSSGSYFMGTAMYLDATNLKFTTRGAGAGTDFAYGAHSVIRVKIEHNTSDQYQWSVSTDGGQNWTVTLTFRVSTGESFGSDPHYIKFWGDSADVRIDNFEVVFGEENITPFGTSTSQWGTWVEVKDATTQQEETIALEVIPESSFDQNEPATSYKVGTSTMAVDMVGGSWPNISEGIVNTSRASDTFATQTYQPLGIDLVYQRSWDSTPGDFSDPFDGANGTTYDTSKWELSTGTAGTIDIQSNQLRMNVTAQKKGLISVWKLTGDFDIEIFMTHLFPVAGSGIVLGSKADLNADLSYQDFNNDIVGVVAQDGNWQAFSYGSQNDGQSTLVDDTDKYWRITRIGNVFTFYHKANVGDSWTQIRSVDNGISTGSLHMYVKLQSNQTSNTDIFFDDFIINSGNVIADNPVDASWQPWKTIKDANTIETENQNYADNAVTTHETVTYDHSSFATQTDLSTKQNDIPVQDTAPSVPSLDDLWIDTSS
jgi:hypothetical protein